MEGKRLAQVGKNCVACGSCLEVCPLGAISIWKGTMTQLICRAKAGKAQP